MKPCTVLVVEDDVDCADILAEALRACGHEVAVATNAGALVEQLGSFRPDIVLVDGHLGPVDGIELVRALREGPLAGVAVLLTTGRARAEVAQAAKAAGIVRVLIKPIDLAVLFEAVETEAALGRRSRSKENNLPRARSSA